METYRSRDEDTSPCIVARCSANHKVHAGALRAKVYPAVLGGRSPGAASSGLVVVPAVDQSACSRTRVSAIQSRVNLKDKQCR